MRSAFALIFGLSAALLAAPAGAQVGLGGLQVGLPRTGTVLDPLLDTGTGIANDLSREVSDLAEDRVRRIDRLVRRNRSAIQRDERGEPARRGVLLAMDADAASIAAAEAAGYAVTAREPLDGLGIEVVTLALPEGTTLSEGLEQLADLMPQASVSADNLYFQSGGAMVASTQGTASASGPIGAAVGMIDGAPATSIPVSAVQGFAQGAGVASNHGSAIVSLLRGQGVRTIRVADVYGTDPAGGNAMAIARGLNWLVGEGSDVVTISLVGPQNRVLERALAAARQHGVVVVAAVGNDGPAAPPAYPASYDGVVAVTGVDGRERALIEAGRALHLDYAAPGADITGLDKRGRSVRLRGTSYATPLVAARIAAAVAARRDWRRTLDAEAVDLGDTGHDDSFGRGLVCRSCAAN